MSANPNDRLARGTRPNHGYIIWPVIYILGVVAFAAAASAWSGHGGLRGHGMFARHHGPMQAEAVRERVAFGLEWGLRKLDATPEQEQQIQRIGADTLDRMIALHERHAQSRETLQALLGADVIDRAALETWRAAEMASFDEASRQLTDAAASALEVLTPEQRARLAEHMAKHHRGGD